MSASDVRSARLNGSSSKKNPAVAAYALPPTASRAALLERGSDHRFRVLVHDLFTVAARMETVRGYFGRWMGISAPQYSLMVAIAHMQGSTGVNVGNVARALHVSSAFVASESSKLARRGLLAKRTSPDDRRGVLLSVAPGGRAKIDGISKQIRDVNDLFFGVLDKTSFTAVSAAAAALVKSSTEAIKYLESIERKPKAATGRRASGEARQWREVRTST
jgi:MarR family transcriptional regulator, organic hydroperoxide resistance regulator